MQSGEAGSQKLLDSAERYSLYLAMSLEDQVGRTVTTSGNLGEYRYYCASITIYRYMM